MEATTNEPVRPAGGYDWMDPERFLKEYKLKIASEFEIDGHAAEWANNGHRFWGKEDAIIALARDDPDMSGRDYPMASAALTPDERYLAVSTNAVIRLYELWAKTMVLELKAHQENIDQLHFAPSAANETTPRGGGESYTLVSFGRHDWVDGRIMIWRLNASATGLHLSRGTPFATDSLALGAVGAISRDLIGHHGLDASDLSAIRKDMACALGNAEEKSRAKAVPSLRADLPGFGIRNPISGDGKRLITLEKNNDTQGGLRPLPDMPRIVVRKLVDMSEEWRLTGHQDAIMWAGWSPDDRWIAEASWDETYGIWNPRVRDEPEGHLIGPSGGQNWIGDFSADCKYIVFSGGMPTQVAAYEVESGELVAELNHPGIRGWVRELAWSPIDHTVAAIVNQSVVLWHPLEDNTSQPVLEIKSDGSLLDRYNDLSLVKWVDDGQKLILRDTANNLFVWDIRMGKKWRFQRPDGLALHAPNTPDAVFFVKRLSKEGTVLSVDGDGKVRFWSC